MYPRSMASLTYSSMALVSETERGYTLLHEGVEPVKKSMAQSPGQHGVFNFIEHFCQYTACSSCHQVLLFVCVVCHTV